MGFLQCVLLLCLLFIGRKLPRASLIHNKLLGNCRKLTLIVTAGKEPKKWKYHQTFHFHSFLYFEFDDSMPCVNTESNLNGDLWSSYTWIILSLVWVFYLFSYLFLALRPSQVSWAPVTRIFAVLMLSHSSCKVFGPVYPFFYYFFSKRLHSFFLILPAFNNFYGILNFS